MRHTSKDLEYKGKHNSQNPENEADFKKAYAKLANRMSSQDEADMLGSAGDLRQLQTDRRRAEGRRSFQERVQHNRERTKAKVDHIRAELQKREVEECTFAPKTLRKTEKRKLDDFLKDQKKHLDRREETVKKLAQKRVEEEEKEMVTQPLINSHSKILAEGVVDKEPVYERLFAKSKKEISIPKPESKKARKQSGTARQLQLYEEAKKRQERLTERQKKEDEELKANMFSREYTKDPYVQQRYAKEFNSVLSSISCLDSLLTLEQMSNLKYDYVDEVLIRMSYIRPKGAAEEKARGGEETVDWGVRIWEILEGESRGGVSPEALKVFTAAVMKILMAESGDGNGRYGNFNEKNEFTLNQKQANAVHKDFNLLYLNRNTYNAPSSKSLEEAECTFKPNLSGSMMNTNRATALPKQKTSQHIDQMLQFKEQQEMYNVL
eukprot:TRINITY_DN5121_c0_g2_i1.p1 TRINITY_DN5121_c0_g2~~TRINITY_DN5121_c0_g2_i1.p1  ORF type:complete len:437 (-),score=138.64 TRINITY_DN5121_c0_g2_i1:2076-3386(-)